MFCVRIIISPSKEMTKTTLFSDVPAIHLYNGLQFRYLRAGLVDADILFLNSHLRIISAEYGALKPLDPIRPYRRDFTEKGLYKAWGDKIYQSLKAESSTILNLASDEFAKTITRFQTADIQIISVSFFERNEAGELKKHASISKKGRGQMVNFIARNRLTDFSAILAFGDLGYQFSEKDSTPENWVFIRTKD